MRKNFPPNSELCGLIFGLGFYSHIPWGGGGGGGGGGRRGGLISFLFSHSTSPLSCFFLFFFLQSILTTPSHISSWFSGLEMCGVFICVYSLHYQSTKPKSLFHGHILHQGWFLAPPPPSPTPPKKKKRKRKTRAKKPHLFL